MLTFASSAGALVELHGDAWRQLCIGSVNGVAVLIFPKLLDNKLVACVLHRKGNAFTLIIEVDAVLIDPGHVSVFAHCCVIGSILTRQIGSPDKVVRGGVYCIAFGRFGLGQAVKGVVGTQNSSVTGGGAAAVREGKIERTAIFFICVNDLVQRFVCASCSIKVFQLELCAIQRGRDVLTIDLMDGQANGISAAAQSLLFNRCIYLFDYIGLKLCGVLHLIFGIAGVFVLVFQQIRMSVWYFYGENIPILIAARIGGLLVVYIVGTVGDQSTLCFGLCIVGIKVDRGLNQCCGVFLAVLHNQCIGQGNLFCMTDHFSVRVDDNRIIDRIGTLVIMAGFCCENGMVLHIGFSLRFAYTLPLSGVGESLGFRIKVRIPDGIIHLDCEADIESVGLTCIWIVKILKPVF